MTIKQISLDFFYASRSRVELKMKLFRVFLVAFSLEIAGGNVKRVNQDLNHACIIRFLQIKGKLEENLLAQPAPPDLCRILLPLIYANHSERLCLRLWETRSVKADCVFEKLKKSEFIDLELRMEIYSKSKHIPRTDKKRRMHEVTGLQREILINIAKSCRSDPTYGGLFDRTLGINSSLIVLQENFCLLKYVADNKFVMTPIDTNPKNIETSKIDCQAVLTKCEEESEQKLLEAFRKRKFSLETISCLLEKYHQEKIFGWNLAKDFMKNLHLSKANRRAEDWRISKILSDFTKKSSNCLYSFNWSLF